LTFSPDGQFVAAGRAGGVADLWNANTGTLVHRYALGSPGTLANVPTAVAFSPGGHRFATGCLAEVVEWQTPTDRRLRSLSPPDHNWTSRPRHLHRVAYSPRGKLAAGATNIVSVWLDLHRKNAQTINWPEGAILGLAFSPTAEKLAVARGRDVGLWSFDLDEDNPHRHRRERVLRHGETIRAVAFTQDGQTLLAGGDDWTIHVWDVATGQKRNSFNWRIGPILSLAVAPDGMTVAVTGAGRPGILIWDLE
jgi:WD40 repeat protein